jgi:hypothetical protein
MFKRHHRLNHGRRPTINEIALLTHRSWLRNGGENRAPREYGQLIKLGNPDGGPLSLHVVTYAVPAVESKPLKPIDAPSTPAIEAQYGELDPT